MAYCIYLRKSRADIEAESYGEGETLARHEKILLELAQKLRLTVTQIYREIVSGDTIAARPVMQKLLAEIESGLWEGVLVMEVERLARGDTIDQGIVAQTFKYSGTKIITPIKTYDPNNEFDEEYFEFGLFMSRREYKTINRRLQRGRIAAAKEGKFVGSIAPYGYERVKIKNSKGYTLAIVPEEAEIVKMIFTWYTSGFKDENGEVRRLGMQQIARKLNQMRIPPIRHDYWQKETIKSILDNPTYAGKIRWNLRPRRKKTINGKMVIERPINHDSCIIVDGLHEAIIDEETYNLAQKYIKENPPAPVGHRKTIKNPLAGLIRCGKCGRSMVFRRGVYPKKPDYIVCHARDCDNVSAPFKYVEKRVLAGLEQWLKEYKLEIKGSNSPLSSNTELMQKSLKNIDAEIATLEKQLNATYDLLEQGIYTTEKFLERSRVLTERIAEAKKSKSELEKELGTSIEQDQIRRDFIPKVEQVLEIYHKLPTAAQKNELLKEVLDKAVYTKTVIGSFRGASADDFELILYPRLPRKKEQ